MRVAVLLCLVGCYLPPCPPDVVDELAECRAELRDVAVAGATDAQAMAVYEVCKKRKGLTDG
jgi:hypothetical protein